MEGRAMNFTQADLQHIKWSLLVLLLALAMGGGLIFISQKYADKAEQTKNQAYRELNNARNKLNADRDDLQNMATYTREFTAIVQQGIIGEERRLSMIEVLNGMKNRNLVLDFKYSISPQQTYKSPVALNPGNYELHYSPMKFQLELLHEGQLMRFIDSLVQDMPGWFILESCNLDRSSDTSTHLKAECAGGLLTLKNRNDS
jgi:hypothetical protein